MKTSLFGVVTLAAAAAGAGMCNIDFKLNLNPSSQSVAVPLILSEGNSGFTYEGFAEGGSDLSVTTAVGGSPVALPYEIECWNPQGTSVVWVKMPSLSADSLLTLTWGEDKIADKPDEAVFAEYWTVLHMNDTETSVDAMLGKAAVFGSSDKVQKLTVTPSGFNKAFTISFWFKADSLTARDRYISNLRPDNNGSIAVLYGFTEGKIELFTNPDAREQGSSDPRQSSKITVPDFDWHHYAYVYDGTVLKGYRDGYCIFAKNEPNFMIKPGTGEAILYMGGSSTAKDFLPGCVDEYRFLPSAISEAELAVQCETQSAHYLYPSIDVTFPEVDEGTALTDFPVLISLDRASTFGKLDEVLSAVADGTLRLKVKGTTEYLEMEKELLMASGPDAGVSFWTTVPLLNADTVLSVTYPKTATPTGSPISTLNRNLWGDDYLFVWHLNAEANTDRRHNSADLGYLISPGQSFAPPADGPTGRYAAMRTGKGLSFSTNVFEGGGVGRALTNVYTISFWARRDDFDNPHDAYLFSCNGRAILAGYGYGNNFHLWGSGYGYSERSCLEIPDSSWHHYAYVADGNRLSGYRDGECMISGVPIQNFGVIDLSAHSATVGSPTKAENAFNGAIDEFRVEGIARSAEWIKASYLNQCIRKNGVRFGNAPNFKDNAVAVSGENSIGFAVGLSGRAPCDVFFCHGDEDGGTDASAWDSMESLGNFAGEAEAVKTLSGLTSGEKVFARFLATNIHGAAWSPVIAGRAKVAKKSHFAKITFPGFAGGEALNGFPVCIRLPASPDLPEAADSLRVETEDGCQLPYETENWDRTSQSVIWVRVPELSASTVLYVRWSINEVPFKHPNHAIWNDDYVRVYHFAPSRADSSVFKADIAEDTDKSTDVSGMAGHARGFGSGVCFTAYAPIYDVGNGFTLSYSAKALDHENDQYVFQVRSDKSEQTAVLYSFGKDGDGKENDGRMELYLQETPPSSGNSGKIRSRSRFNTAKDDEWHHYAIVHDGRNIKAYCDGAEVKSSEYLFTLGAQYPYNNNGRIAFGGTEASGSLFKGMLDEWRLEKVSRGAPWIAAESANMHGTLASVGPYCGVGLVVNIR